MNKSILLALIFVFSLGVVFAPAGNAQASSDQRDWCPDTQGIKGDQGNFVWDEGDENYGTVTINGVRRSIVGGLVPCGRSCDDPTTEINEAAECTFCHFFYLLTNIINWIVFRIAPTLAVLLIAFGGFTLVVSRGNPSQSQKGKDILIWTFVGLAVIFVSWMVVNSIFAGIGVAEWSGLREGWWQFSCGLN